jgi:RNA polymerase sigma-70 factor (ECF subfamily)
LPAVEKIISSFKKTHDPLFIEILFDRYSHLIFAVSMKYLKNEEESKDAVLRIFEKLPSDLVTYQIQYFSSWLHTVTRNHCLRFLSQNKIHFENSDDIPDVIEDDEDDFQKKYLPLLGDAIEQLNSEQKTCIDLFYIQNLSYEEITTNTGYTLNQVKSYIQNGKRNLKIILLKGSNEK